MNKAVVIPSINARPRMISFLRETEPDVLVIVVGDLKAPPELADYCKQHGAVYYGVDDQKRLPYESVNAIPWNCIMRRNLGVLEAVRFGAEMVVSMDDDNLPERPGHIAEFAALLEAPVTGNQVVSPSGWFNLGELAIPRFYYRGFPYSLRGVGRVSYNDASGLIGIANGLIYGDPDINATERIEKAPSVTFYDHEAQEGILVDPCDTWTAINTQNTAYRKELLPLAFALPGVGRYDDIWALYIAQRVMEATDYMVYFGPPAVTQERNRHNLLRDLEHELYGMRDTEALCDLLKSIEVKADETPLDNLARIADGLQKWPGSFPHGFLRTWIEDMGGLL